MGTVRSLLADLREVATRERTDGTTQRRPGDAARAVIAALVLDPAHPPLASPDRHRGSGRPALRRDPRRRTHAVPDPLPTGRAVGGGPAGGHRAAPAAVAPGPRPGGRGRGRVDPRPVDGVPGARQRPVGRLPGHLRSHRCAPLPDGPPVGRGGDGPGGVAPPGPADPALRPGPRRVARAVEPLPVAWVPHRPDRRHRARLGRGPRGRVPVRHPGRSAVGPAGHRCAAGVRHRGDRRAADDRATGRPRGVRGDAPRPGRCASSPSGATRPTRSSSRARGASSPTATRRPPSCRAGAPRWSTRRT